MKRRKRFPLNSETSAPVPNPATSTQSEVVEYRITIQTVGNSTGDGDLRRAINADVKALPDAKDIWVLRKPEWRIEGLTAGPEFWNEIIAVSIPVVCATGAYIGKKALDVISDIVKAKLMAEGQRLNDVRSVDIYGPNGEVVKRFDVPRVGSDR